MTKAKIQKVLLVVFIVLLVGILMNWRRTIEGDTRLNGMDNVAATKLNFIDNAMAADATTKLPESLAPGIGDCRQWEVKFVRAEDGIIEAGWEPVSGAIYGRGGNYGILLRRCIDTQKK